MDEKYLDHPLLPLVNQVATTTTVDHFVTPTSNNSSKTISHDTSTRFLIILLIGFISMWANHEASKGFVITVVNDMKNTPVGDKFTLFYISNDEVIRLVQSSSVFAAEVLFPGDRSMPEMLINQVEIQLVGHNLTNDHTVAVKSFGQTNKYVLPINPLVMEFDDFRYRMRKEIQRGMAEILLLDQQNSAPKFLLDGMVEYISDLAGFGGPESVLKVGNSSGKCWEDEDPRVVAKFLAYGEEKSKGFVGRLYQEMNRDGWYDRMMDKVFGIPAIHLCALSHDFTKPIKM